MNAPHQRADFSSVSHEQMCTRAHALVPALRERAAASEAAGDLLPETIADLNQSGLVRILQPKRWGGMELDFVALVDACDILARGCISTSWALSNLAVHHLMLAWYEEKAQEEVWGADRDAYIASGIAYPQGRGRQVDGGIELSGLWNFSSGVTPSGWNMLACIVREEGKPGLATEGKPIDYVMCLVPAGEYEVLDDWHVMGLKGTGSRSVKCDKVFVPAHRALSMTYQRRGLPFPGWASNHGATYRVPLMGLAAQCLIGTAIGNAQAMFDAITGMIKERSTVYVGLKMRDLGTVQARVGLAGVQIDTARLLMRNDCIDAQRIVAGGGTPDLEYKLRLKRNGAFAMQLATNAVDTLYALAGANGLYTKGPMERIFRDQHAAGAHINFSIDAHTSSWGLVALGGEFTSPTL